MMKTARDIFVAVDYLTKVTFTQQNVIFILIFNKPIGASPGRDYVLMRMVLQIIYYSTQYGMVHQKRGRTLRGLQIKTEREECKFFNPPQASLKKILVTVAAIFTRLSIKSQNWFFHKNFK